jgi:hypothetical protein
MRFQTLWHTDGCEKVRCADESLVVGQRGAFPVRVPNFRLGDNPGVIACWLESNAECGRFRGSK